MELKQIKELMATMGRTGIKRLSLKRESFELTLERDESRSKTQENSFDVHDDESSKRSVDWNKADVPLPKSGEYLVSSSIAPSVPLKGDEKALYITSPMVGTLYLAPSPEDPPFVKVGDRVEKNTVVCIVEAMKVTNEIKAGESGVIAEILVENAHPVEFGTKLFRIVE